jgi:hypothetical protein
LNAFNENKISRKKKKNNNEKKNEEKKRGESRINNKQKYF